MQTAWLLGWQCQVFAFWLVSRPDITYKHAKSPEDNFYWGSLGSPWHHNEVDVCGFEWASQYLLDGLSCMFGHINSKLVCVSKWAKPLSHAVWGCSHNSARHTSDPNANIRPKHCFFELLAYIFYNISIGALLKMQLMFCIQSWLLYMLQTWSVTGEADSVKWGMERSRGRNKQLTVILFGMINARLTSICRSGDNLLPLFRSVWYTDILIYLIYY